MRQDNNLLRIIWSGLAAGILLGLFLKLMQSITSLKVYTLLLNVDYIPILNQLTLSEFVEFSLHLIISVLLSGVFVIFLRHRNFSWRKNISVVSLTCTVIGLMLYLTTSLSERTPSLYDPFSLLIWLIAHLLYGIILGYLLFGLSQKASK
ncbi:hypothetical protein ACK8P5_05240 [Paenibacillus sp. EC2-1]|uniref:hypothetical protein n=1 Tax=Paenibacillus sp. EC2-1 TaxID=3388665 RepID=UPI003BEECA12